jgi:small subunit ribosomal protein S6e
MPVLIVSDQKTGKSQRIELDDNRMSTFIGLRIGESIDGAVAELPNYQLKLTGGTDKDGIPMRPDVHGSAKIDILLRGGIGYKPKKAGERKRVVVRGNTIGRDSRYLNFVKIEKKTKVRTKETKGKKTK